MAEAREPFRSAPKQMATAEGETEDQLELPSILHPRSVHVFEPSSPSIHGVKSQESRVGNGELIPGARTELVIGYLCVLIAVRR